MKKISITLALVAIAISTSAQDVRALMGRQTLSDKTSQEVVEYRKSINDSLFFDEVEAKGMYKDHKVGYDGNATYPMLLATKYQASQCFSLTGFGVVNYFGGHTAVGGGLGAQYGYRAWLAGLDVAFMTGKTDDESSVQQNFSEQDYRLWGGYQILSWKEHHHQIYLVGGTELKLRSHNEAYEFGETRFMNHVKAHTLGFFGGIRYQGSPKMSRWSWFIQVDAGYGTNFGSEDKGSVVTPDYVAYNVGGTNANFQANLKVGVSFNVFNKTIRRK